MSSLRLPADYESARRIGPWLRERLNALGATDLYSAGELELAIHEVAINIVDHAFGGEAPDQQYIVSLTPGVDNGELHAQLQDAGAPFDAAPAPDLDHPQIGGYGLFLTEQLTTSMSYERHDGLNVWTLTFAASTEANTAQTPNPPKQETRS